MKMYVLIVDFAKKHANLTPLKIFKLIQFIVKAVEFVRLFVQKRPYHFTIGFQDRHFYLKLDSALCLMHFYLRVEQIRVN